MADAHRVIFLEKRVAAAEAAADGAREELLRACERAEAAAAAVAQCDQLERELKVLKPVRNNDDSNIKLVSHFLYFVKATLHNFFIFGSSPCPVLPQVLRSRDQM